MSRHSEPPRVKRPKAWHFPTPATLTLPNGLVAMLYHRPGQHVVSASLVIDLPLTTEPAAREGVASLVARTLSEGTRTHPGTSFTDAVEDSGAGLDTSVSYSATQVYLDVPASHLATGLSLLAEAVTEPTLENSDIERNRALRLTEIQHQLASPAQLANLALRRALVQPTNRSSRMAGGHSRSVGLITGEDARAFHARHYHPGAAILVVAGDFDARIEQQLAVTLGGWKPTHQTLDDHEIPQPKAPSASLIHRDDAVQADIRLAHYTIDRTDPRWADLQVATRILGGAFGSRANRVLREERGYTYGAGMSNSPGRHGGYSVMQTAVRNEVLAETLALLPELLDVAAAPFTAEEVAQARDYLIGAAPMHYATASGLGHAVSSLLTAGLTGDFIDTTHEAIRRVTPESATEVAIELLAPADATCVVVGDAGVGEAALRNAGWEPTLTSVESISDPLRRGRP